MFVHVLYENPDWLPPLRQALAARNLPVKEHYITGGGFDLSKPPAPGVYVNRMSPSAHTREHGGGVAFVREFLYYLESHGRRVINGSGAFALEVSKARQDAALQAFGIRTPRTVAVVGRQEILEAARSFEFPFLTKHNQGGKGLGIQLFQDFDSLQRYVEGPEFIPSPDEVTVLQQFIQPVEPFVTRVEIVGGRFLYAIRSDTSRGFKLCPADACEIESKSGAQAGDAFCPVGDTGLFSRREGLERDPIIEQYLGFCAKHELDVAGIEFVEDRDGLKYTYDVNANTNFNSTVESKHGLNGMDAIAALVEGELRTLGQRAA